MIIGKHVAPQSEVIRAILLEDSPCRGGHLGAGGVDGCELDLASLLHGAKSLLGLRADNHEVIRMRLSNQRLWLSDQ